MGVGDMHVAHHMDPQRLRRLRLLTWGCGAVIACPALVTRAQPRRVVALPVVAAGIGITVIRPRRRVALSTRPTRITDTVGRDGKVWVPRIADPVTKAVVGVAAWVGCRGSNTQNKGQA